MFRLQVPELTAAEEDASLITFPSEYTAEHPIAFITSFILVYCPAKTRMEVLFIFKVTVLFFVVGCGVGAGVEGCGVGAGVGTGVEGCGMVVLSSGVVVSAGVVVGLGFTVVGFGVVTSVSCTLTVTVFVSVLPIASFMVSTSV